MEGFSILIPSYNHVCVGLVERLKELCDAMPSLCYEILVGDDCSKDSRCLDCNAAIGQMENCVWLRREHNRGSAAMRNLLAKRSRYEWLLFLDCDVEVLSPQFISCYWENRRAGFVVNGGVSVLPLRDGDKGNLRHLYESRAEPRHIATERSKRPYKSFRSANFMVPRDIMLSCPFEERFRRLEDIYWGKTLRARSIGVCHIQNPVVLADFEDNPTYINKVERDMLALHKYHQEFRGYSTLLSVADSLGHTALLPLLRLWHRAFGRLERRWLEGRHPCLWLFNFYRIGYFVTHDDSEAKQQNT